MSDLDDIDRRILEVVERAHEDAKPFEREEDGISYKDIRDEFTNEDFGGVSPEMRVGIRLHNLSQQGYLIRTYKAANNPNRYRLGE